MIATFALLAAAGSLILGISILLWALTSYPKAQTFSRDYAAEEARAGQCHSAEGKA